MRSSYYFTLSPFFVCECHSFSLSICLPEGRWRYWNSSWLSEGALPWRLGVWRRARASPGLGSTLTSHWCSWWEWILAELRPQIPELYLLLETEGVNHLTVSYSYYVLVIKETSPHERSSTCYMTLIKKKKKEIQKHHIDFDIANVIQQISFLKNNNTCSLFPNNLKHAYTG